ncbi:hypothetical protein CDAR_385751, partial [Caerostris darwini]
SISCLQYVKSGCHVQAQAANFLKTLAYVSFALAPGTPPSSPCIATE